jgi:hypothetical protein
LSKLSRDTVLAWLGESGFLVAPLTAQLPSNAEWGLLVSTPPPLQVKLRLLGLKNGDLVFGVGVNFSEKHVSEINKLKPEERVKLSAEIISSILSVCPYCRIALRESLANPVALISEILIKGDEASKQRLVDDAARLVNVFLIVNAILWKKFPLIEVAEGKQSNIFM